MEVILNKDVERIGLAGQVVKVKDGFARNFLLPNNLAVVLTPLNLKKVEQEKQKKSQELQRLKNEAEVLRDKLAALSLTIPVLTQEEDKIYGSITSLDVVKALGDEGVEIDKNLIVLTEPVKKLGIFEIPVKLHPEVMGKIKIWVVKK